MINADRVIFHAINNLSRKSKILDGMAIFFARYLAYLLVALLLLFAYLKKDVTVFVVPVATALLARFLINQLIYFFYKRKRPPEVLNIVPLIPKPNHPSFPSGHAASFFAISFALFVYSIPLATIFLLLTCGMVIFRIFCGVHWPSDIIAGIASGLLGFLIVYSIKVIT